MPTNRIRNHYYVNENLRTQSLEVLLFVTGHTELSCVNEISRLRCKRITESEFGITRKKIYTENQINSIRCFHSFFQHHSLWFCLATIETIESQLKTKDRQQMPTDRLSPWSSSGISIAWMVWRHKVKLKVNVIWCLSMRSSRECLVCYLRGSVCLVCVLSPPPIREQTPHHIAFILWFRRISSHLKIKL